MLILICKGLMASLEMKKYKFKYRFLVFLYAYLRQADLSLDMAMWSPCWRERLARAQIKIS